MEIADHITLMSRLMPLPSGKVKKMFKPRKTWWKAALSQSRHLFIAGAMDRVILLIFTTQAIPQALAGHGLKLLDAPAVERTRLQWIMIYHQALPPMRCALTSGTKDRRVLVLRVATTIPMILCLPFSPLVPYHLHLLRVCHPQQPHHKP